MSATLAFILRRTLLVVPVVLAIAALNFVLLHLAPGDAADIIAAQSGGASAEFVGELRRSFGLDRPLYQQFVIYIGRLLTLDLGILACPAAAGVRPDRRPRAGDPSSDGDGDRACGHHWRARRNCRRDASPPLGRRRRLDRWRWSSTPLPSSGSASC